MKMDEEEGAFSVYCEYCQNWSTLQSRVQVGSRHDTRDQSLWHTQATAGAGAGALDGDEGLQRNMMLVQVDLLQLPKHYLDLKHIAIKVIIKCVIFILMFHIVLCQKFEK